MSRRRLRVICSSSDEEEEEEEEEEEQKHQQVLDDDDDVVIDDIETDMQTVALNSSNPTPDTNNSTTNNNRNATAEPISLVISDDEDDIIEDVILDNTNYNSGYGNNNNHTSFGVSDSPVNGVLECLGLRLKKEWLDSCLTGLQASVRGFHLMDDSAKGKLCFHQFLMSDMNYCGAGVLPPNVHSMHLVDLKGPFVLQVDEIVNISCPLRGRFQNAAPGIKRCLKLSMTDGVQRVFGMEYRPIKDLEALASAGLKVVICNGNVRHGMLMLVPEVLEVLGGSVEELDAARHRLINEINKPPRGKRNRTGVVPSLASRGATAAWPPHSGARGDVGNTTGLNTTPLQASAQGSTGTTPGISVSDRHRQTVTAPVGGDTSQPKTSSVPWPHERVDMLRNIARPAITPLPDSGQGSASISVNGRFRQESEVPVSRNNAEPYAVSAQQPLERVFVPRHIDEPLTEVVTPARATGQSVNYVPVEDVTFAAGDDSAVRNSSAMDMDVEEISMVDELVHTFIFSRDKETPFTYLASLSAKLAAIEDQGSVIRGKIKCFLTGVKGFQYKQRATYELRVYIDDGSLISEILIEHNVVQNGIGYSPQEVTSALASSDSKRVSEMKETLKQFQKFLVNFEGTMLVEMNKTSLVPVAVEMDQGCPASDALLLLNRLKSYTSAQSQTHSHSNPINLSP